MLTEEDKQRIKREHLEFMEKRHRELEQKLEQEESDRLAKEELRRVEQIRQEEEEKFYASNPAYVKHTGRDGTIRWDTREEYLRKRHPHRRSHRKSYYERTKRIWSKISLVIILVAMGLTIFFALKLVSE